MKLLSGLELAGFIKERQAKTVRGLVQAAETLPKLAIIVTIDHPAINIYMRMKKKYGADVGIDVDIHSVEQTEVKALIKKLNQDESVHGIIVQLPLQNTDETDEIVNLVASSKDVDALGQNPNFEPATATAILWLLAGYNVELKAGKQIVIIGHGKLVGEPLARMLEKSDIKYNIVNSKTKNIADFTKNADVIITGTGQPGLLTSQLIPSNCVVVDAGVASEGGKTSGDVAKDVYTARDDLKITPQKGGVGPLTVCALFENVIIAARNSA